MDYIYVIKLGQYCKIGRTKSLDSRIEAINKGLPLPAQVFYAKTFKNKDESTSAEKKLQNYFKKHNTRGEWFDIDVDLICKKAKELFGDTEEINHSVKEIPKKVDLGKYIEENKIKHINNEFFKNIINKSEKKIKSREGIIKTLFGNKYGDIDQLMKIRIDELCAKDNLIQTSGFVDLIDGISQVEEWNLDIMYDSYNFNKIYNLDKESFKNISYEYEETFGNSCFEVIYDLNSLEETRDRFNDLYFPKKTGRSNFKIPAPVAFKFLPADMQIFFYFIDEEWGDEKKITMDDLDYDLNFDPISSPSTLSKLADIFDWYGWRIDYGIIKKNEVTYLNSLRYYQPEVDPLYYTTLEGGHLFEDEDAEARAKEAEKFYSSPSKWMQDPINADKMVKSKIPLFPNFFRGLNRDKDKLNFEKIDDEMNNTKLKDISTDIINKFFNLDSIPIEEREIFLNNCTFGEFIEIIKDSVNDLKSMRRAIQKKIDLSNSDIIKKN